MCVMNIVNDKALFLLYSRQMDLVSVITCVLCFRLSPAYCQSSILPKSRTIASTTVSMAIALDPFTRIRSPGFVR